MIFSKCGAALCLTLAISTATLVHAQAGVSASPQWKTFRPGLTTEADFLRLFGEPNNVVMRFMGLGEFQRWRTTNSSHTYDFEYELASKENLIYDGPFGDAGNVIVRFTGDRKLWQVEWVYHSAYRLHLRTGEGPSHISVEQMEASIGKHPLIQKMSSEIGPLAGIYRFKVDDRILDVQYFNEANDISVYLTKDGFFKFD